MPAKRSEKAGLPPGSMVHIGEKKSKWVKITVINYDKKNFTEKEVKKAGECKKYKDKKNVTWINVSGIHKTEVIEEIGKCFNLHPLLLEDIVNTDQRPKMENYGEYIFIVVKMLYQNKTGINAEQVSLVLGPNFVLSFQESEDDVFDLVRERIRKGKGKTREMGADFLTYSLIDAIVDHYFIILERIGELVEELEEDMVKEPTPRTLEGIHRLKREMIFLRKSVWPLREVINAMLRSESKLIKKTTTIYLRDVYDHTIQVIDTVETFRDMLSGMIDLYLSSISNRMNEIMKVLTIIGTIFIPLTFVTGLYGMNFRYMPELESPWGYPVALGVMLLIAIMMIIYFKKKKWL
jgi:magnesium transporter